MVSGCCKIVCFEMIGSARTTRVAMCEIGITHLRNGYFNGLTRGDREAGEERLARQEVDSLLELRS